MLQKQLICKKCGSEREVGRKLCRQCNLTRLREIVAVNRPRYTYTILCKACKKEIQAWRKTQEICGDCYRESRIKPKCTGNYVYAKESGHTQHRDLAQKTLGRKLHTNEVVHHLDENPRNNAITNLIVLTRSMHGKLHLYLDKQRVILEKSGNENFENCWDSLRVPMTTAWLETTSAKVTKLWEIGQSAAEPLMEKSYEEGSETMHEASEYTRV